MQTSIKFQIATLLAFIGTLHIVGQQKTTNKQQKDSIDTEVVSVVTSYAPKISDAIKISENPGTDLTTSTIKKLNYNFVSVPVASTFNPKTGKLKGIQIPTRDVLFNNFLTLGYGNYNTPYLELFLSRAERYEPIFGLHLQFKSSDGNISSTPINSDYKNLSANLLIKDFDYDYDWNSSITATYDKINWYGLPQKIIATNTNFSTIVPEKKYYTIGANGQISFKKLDYLSTISGDITFLKDNYNSKELLLTAKPNFEFSLTNISNLAKKFLLNTKIESLIGSNQRTINSSKTYNYTFLNVGAMPHFYINNENLDIKIGAKLYFSNDFHAKKHKIFLYPDIEISYPIVENSSYIFAGIDGDLALNSYQKYRKKNPYVAPNLFFNQTSKPYHAFIGFNNQITNKIGFSIKANYSNEKNRPLFINKNRVTDNLNKNVLAYNYGNSFDVIYDDVKSFVLDTEIDLKLIDRLDLKLDALYQKFSQTKAKEMWNTPNFYSKVSAIYTYNKWNFSSQVYFVGKRKSITYNKALSNKEYHITTLNPYLDINMKGSYQLTKNIQLFANINNLLNTNYERYQNYDVQGLQILGGITWKFNY